MEECVVAVGGIVGIVGTVVENPDERRGMGLGGVRGREGRGGEGEGVGREGKVR